MAVKPISVKMDESLIAKLDEVAKSNHRKRSPEINVAVEFYLKYQGVDLDELKDRTNNAKINDDSQNLKDEKTSSFDAGDYGFND